MTLGAEIRITGQQFFCLPDLLSDTDGEKAERERKIELCTDGSLSLLENGDVHISYDESELTGMSGAHTTFALSGDVMSLSRTGTAHTHLVFEQGKRHLLCEGHGEHPSVCVDCRRLEKAWSESGGRIFVEYSLSIAGAKLEHNAYTIQVTV